MATRERPSSEVGGGRAAELRGSRLTTSLGLSLATPLTVSRSEREERKSPWPPRRGLGKGGTAPCVVTLCEHVRRRPGREDALGEPRSPLTPAAMMAGPGRTTRRSLGLRARGRFLSRVIPPRTNFNQAPPPGRWRHLRRSSAFQQLPEPSPPPHLFAGFAAAGPAPTGAAVSTAPAPAGRPSHASAEPCRKCSRLPLPPRRAPGLSSRALFRKVLWGGTLWLRTPERKLLS